MNSKRSAVLAGVAAVAAVVPMLAATAPAQANLPATKVTTANLPTAAQIKTPSPATVTITGTGKGGGQAPLSLCQSTPWAAYHPNAEFTRTYATRAKGAVRPTQAGATIASFATHAAAVKAANSMAAGFRCTARATHVDGYVSGSARTTTRTVTLATGQVVHLALLTYDTMYARQVDTVESVAVVATGTHVELVSLGYYAEYGAANSNAALATIKATLPTLAR